MNVLVTGGLGFIGSFVSERFVDEGWDVFVIDDMSGNVVDDISGAMLVRECDMRMVHAADFGMVMDLIVHCASPVGAVGILDQRGSIVETIVSTTHHAANMAKVYDCPLVNISTSEVYGFSGEYDEKDDCLINAGYNARREYAVGKLAAEFLLSGRSDVQRSISIRPFNVVGPRQSRAKGFVFPTFAEQVLRGETLTVFGTGAQRRAFLGVRDLVEFIYHYVASFAPAGAVHPSMWDGTPINVGNPDNAVSIDHLARMFLAEALESPSEIKRMSGNLIHGPEYAEADGFVKLPMVARAKALGWTPTQGLKNLIEVTLDETRESLDGEIGREALRRSGEG